VKLARLLRADELKAIYIPEPCKAMNILSKRSKGRIPHERGTTFPRDPSSKGNINYH
jgi:hypothetical protein